MAMAFNPWASTGAPNPLTANAAGENKSPVPPAPPVAPVLKNQDEPEPEKHEDTPTPAPEPDNPTEDKENVSDTPTVDKTDEPAETDNPTEDKKDEKEEPKNPATKKRTTRKKTTRSKAKSKTNTGDINGLFEAVEKDVIDGATQAINDRFDAIRTIAVADAAGELNEFSATLCSMSDEAAELKKKLDEFVQHVEATKDKVDRLTTAYTTLNDVFNEV